MMKPFVAWVLSLMVQVAPPEESLKWVKAPEAQETASERRVRYEQIAEAIEFALDDPTIRPFKGGRTREAVVLVSIASWESHFNKDVQFGTGKGVGDKGLSYCLTQQMVGAGKTPSWNKLKRRFALPTDPPEEVVEGWTGSELTQDLRKCFVAARRVVWASMRVCAGNPEEGRLAYYAGGTCTGKDALTKSQQRMRTAEWLLKKVPAPKELLAD